MDKRNRTTPCTVNKDTDGRTTPERVKARAVNAGGQDGHVAGTLRSPSDAARTSVRPALFTCRLALAPARVGVYMCMCVRVDG
jgi:hypothetical protein